MLLGSSHNSLGSMKTFTIGNLLTLFTGRRDALGETKCKAKEGDVDHVLPRFQKEEIGRPESIDDRQTRRKEADLVEGPWKDLVEEALAQIFDRLPFEERFRTVPLVCKDWRNVARSPSSWRNVDMDPWMKAKAYDDCDWEGEVDMTGIVRAVVDLSGGQLRQLRTGYCSSESVSYIAENCPLLTDLSIRNSFLVEDEAAMNLARRCRRLEKLDLSDCYKLSAKSLELFGMKCPRLTHLRRNMVDILHYEVTVAPRGDAEAAAVAAYMSGLKELEMRRMESLTDTGLMCIARSCLQLEKLDLACCSAVTTQVLDDVVHLCQKLRNFVRPIKARMHVAGSKHYVPGIYMVCY